MQPAAGFVVGALSVIEFPAGVKCAEDNFNGGLLMRRMIVDGNAAAVVADGDSGAVLVQRDFDLVGVAIHRLIDRVVEDFPYEVVKSGRTRSADVHAGALANGVEALEDGDAAGVVGGIGCHVCCFVCRCSSLNCCRAAEGVSRPSGVRSK